MRLSMLAVTDTSSMRANSAASAARRARRLQIIAPTTTMADASTAPIATMYEELIELTSETTLESVDRETSKRERRKRKRSKLE